MHCTLGETHIESSATRATCWVKNERTKNRQNICPCLVASTLVWSLARTLMLAVAQTEVFGPPSTAPIWSRYKTYLLSDTVWRSNMDASTQQMNKAGSELNSTIVVFQRQFSLKHLTWDLGFSCEIHRPWFTSAPAKTTHRRVPASALKPVRAVHLRSRQTAPYQRENFKDQAGVRSNSLKAASTQSEKKITGDWI